MALHIIKSAQASAILELEDIFQQDDQILLLEDGCYLYTLTAQKFPGAQALNDHMQSRGLSAKATALGIKLITMKQWALMTRAHSQILTW